MKFILSKTCVLVYKLLTFPVKGCYIFWPWGLVPYKALLVLVHWILNDPAYEHSVPCCVPLHCILAQSISTVYMYKIVICHEHNWQLKTSKIITLQEKHTLMNSCFLMQMTSNLCSHSHKLANTCKSKTGRHWGFQLVGHFIMWYFKNFNLTVFSESVWCSFFLFILEGIENYPPSLSPCSQPFPVSSVSETITWCNVHHCYFCVICY